jgi:hypothetical protein
VRNCNMQHGAHFCMHAGPAPNLGVVQLVRVSTIVISIWRYHHPQGSESGADAATQLVYGDRSGGIPCRGMEGLA